MSEYVIEMLNITKRFPGIVANDNITLQLKKGEIHALLGENGAGKSTLINADVTVIKPAFFGQVFGKIGKKVRPECGITCASHRKSFFYQLAVLPVSE